MKKGKQSVQGKQGLPGKQGIPGKHGNTWKKLVRPWGYSLPAMILIAMIVLFPLAGALADRWGLKTVLLLLGAILLLFLLTVFCIEKESFSSDHS